MREINRRQFLRYGSTAAAAFALGKMLGNIPRALADCPGMSCESFIKDRGILLLETDIYTLSSWPQMAKDAGLNIVGIGCGSISSYCQNFLNAPAGQKFLSKCANLDLKVEHELHAIQELLPRSLFSSHPEYFRMNSSGVRTSDYNCCPSSAAALEIIGNNAVAAASQLVSTTGKYYFWQDDGSKRIFDTAVRAPEHFTKCSFSFLFDRPGTTSE